MSRPRAWWWQTRKTPDHRCLYSSRTWAPTSSISSWSSAYRRSKVNPPSTKAHRPWVEFRELRGRRWNEASWGPYERSWTWPYLHSRPTCCVSSWLPASTSVLKSAVISRWSSQIDRELQVLIFFAKDSQSRCGRSESWSGQNGYCLHWVTYKQDLPIARLQSRPICRTNVKFDVLDRRTCSPNWKVQKQSSNSSDGDLERET